MGGGLQIPVMAMLQVGVAVLVFPFEELQLGPILLDVQCTEGRWVHVIREFLRRCPASNSDDLAL